MSVTPERLKELRALCEAATPGPIKASYDLNDPGGNLGLWKTWDGADRVVASIRTRLPWHENRAKGREEGEANAKLFAAARNALPELLNAIEDLQHEIERLKGQGGDLVGS